LLFDARTSYSSNNLFGQLAPSLFGQSTAPSLSQPTASHNPFMFNITLTLAGKPTLHLGVMKNSTVAFLRSHAGIQWGLSQKASKLLKLKYQSFYITAHPLKHLSTVFIGASNNILIEAQIGGLLGGGVKKTISKSSTATNIKLNVKMQSYHHQTMETGSKVSDYAKSTEALSSVLTSVQKFAIDIEQDTTSAFKNQLTRLSVEELFAFQEA
jgi:hypothetical protein